MTTAPPLDPAGTRPEGEHLSTATPSRYCPVCGEDAGVHGPPVERFGQALCSSAHVEQFVAEVRAERARVAALSDSALHADGAQDASGTQAGNAASGWKPWAMRALCWGGPALAVLLLFGGGSSLLGAAGAVLPYVALLACPLAMVLMMKSMGGMQGHSARQDHTEVVSEERARVRADAPPPLEGSADERA